MMTEQTTNSDETDPETETLARQISKLEYEEHKQEVSDRLKFQVDFAQALLKALLLVNGASIISLLTFIGSDANNIDGVMIWWSFASFAFGVVCALASYFGSFFSQLNFMQTAAMQMWASHGRSHGMTEVIDQIEFERYLKKGVIAMNSGIVGAILSLVGFIAGAFFALEAIL
jgi:hypothetical protein